MATPQDAPTRKKQKARATRKLTEWKKKQAAQSVESGGSAKTVKTVKAVKAPTPAKK